MISLLAGLGLGLSLIVAIGAQNVYVLRQGIRRQHVFAVVAICAVSDAVLIAAGVAGLGLLLEAAPWLVTVARLLGALFLIGYSVVAARRALRGAEEGLHVESSSRRTSSGLTSVVLAVLALTWLNPHVYLDTVLMLGSIAATHGESRWLFASGAMLASILWFTALGYGARYLGRWLTSPRAWRVLDAVIALVMLSIAINLLLPVFTG